ncbi:response regulator [Spirosoma rhododendri]|uniref:Response regulator n=1 Tax=Spirosoma rhododendri TaxID=2728024 RepID=A0A7L5DTM7_9BACT|nr:response regulator [Spirosoma rhododendri]QJD81495.1 response regulator [Spirosoma rhododendri]
MTTSSTSPILVVDSDTDDTFLICTALSAVAPTHPILCFTTAASVLTHLKDNAEKPFLILSEVMLPGMNGLELRQAIEDDPGLRKRSIPFLFMSNPAVDTTVNKAYDLTIQGFFEKPDKHEELKAMLQAIVNYWSYCIPPRS